MFHLLCFFKEMDNCKYTVLCLKDLANARCLSQRNQEISVKNSNLLVIN